MEIFELSRLIFDSCDRIHQATTDMYEHVHIDGTPRYESDDIESIIKDFREWVNHEIDTIRSATSEYREGFDE
tara:strand:- start:316 stop:534 length:219 start_codon:yes stop_codon:yes gene_type:complete